MFRAVNSFSFLFAGKFRWDESHSVAEYTNWWPDQPNNTDGIEDCVFKSFVEGYRGWDDYYCDRKDWIDGGIHALCMMKYTYIYCDIFTMFIMLNDHILKSTLYRGKQI